MDKQYRMLIIDDNEEILDALYDFFNKKPYDIVIANNGLDGLKLFEAEKDGFDIVITDIVMPNISGLGIISIVKQKSPDTPVIAVTGWGEHPETLAAEAQADLVLEKPFDLTELDSFIADLISKKKEIK